MQTKKIKGKLFLNKETISNVNMTSIKVGGIQQPSILEMCDFSRIIDGERVGFDGTCSCYVPSNACSGGCSIGYSCGPECWDPY